MTASLGNADGLADLERHPRQLFGFGVAALLDQDVGKACDEARRDRVVLALVLQLRQQRAARIDLGFAETALPRLHPGLAEHGEIDREHQAGLQGGFCPASIGLIAARLRNSPSL